MDLIKWKKFVAYYARVVLCVYLFLLIVVFPYYAPEGFVKLGVHKYIFFREVGIQCLFMMFPAVAFLTVCQWKHLSWNQLSKTDWAMLFYAATVIVSYICTEWKEKAFWGAEGWSMGLVSQLMFVAIYFAVSRFSDKIEIWYAVLIAASSGVFLIGLLNRFSIYPFWMDSDEPSYFISTIGNINWFCGYWSVLFPIGLVLYWNGECGKPWAKAVLAAYVGLGYMVGIVQGSSSGFLVLGAVLFILFVMSFTENDRLLRWLELMLLFAGSVLIISVVKQVFPGALNYSSEMEEWLTQFAVCSLLLGVVASCHVIAWYLLKKKQHPVRTVRGGVHRTIAVSAFLVGLAIVIITFYCNVVYSRTGKSPVDASVFVFNTDWGNGRGAAWIAGGRAFAAMPVIQKLVGAGPDCFEYCVYGNLDIAEVLYSVFGTSRLTNAHNELLTTLVNTGVCGLMSYVAIFFTSMLRQFRKGAENNFLLVSAVCIFAYAINNLVSFQQVVSTPMVFILIGFGESVLRKCEK